MRAAALLVAAGALGVLPPGLAAQSLQVQPDSLDFGALKAGRTGLLEVSVRNAGSEDLEIRVQVEGEGFSAPTDTLHLAAGGRRSLAVEFSAADTGTYAGELSLQTGELFGTEEGRVGLGASVERPRLSLRPGPGQGLDAGPAPVGRVVKRSLELVNAGRVELVIDSLSIEPRGGPFSLAADPPRRMAPGAGGRVAVLFRPAADGGFRARLRVHSPDLPDTWVPLAGEGMAPRLAVSPLPEVGIDFETVEVGGDSRRTLSLINQGRGDLDLSLQLADEAFEAAGDTAIHLEPGARRDVGVRFHPRYEGPAGAVLVLRSNDPRHRLVEVPLTGRGRVAPPQVEVLENSPLHFGSVPVGKEARAPLVMWNRGGSPYMVRLQLEEESGPEFGLETGTLLLNPGESGRVELTFRPQEVGLREAALLVHTEAGPRRLQLQGSGRFLQIMPSAHDFGRVPVGESGSGIIDLTNTGNSDFSISRIHSTSDDFTIFTQLSPDGEYLLPANGLRSLPVRVTFAPSARGPVSGTLRLEGFWEGAAATLEVLLNGTGVAAEIELHPSGVLDFGYVVVGESGQRTLVATNSGDTALQVEANALTGEARVEPSAFSLDPGGSTTLHVHFSPEALGERFAQILLISNDVRDKAQPIKIRGRGALGSIDLPSIASVLATGKSGEKRLDVPWNPTPLIVRDGTRIDLRIDIPDSLRPALVGRRIDVEWVQLDQNYDPKGGPRQARVQIHADSEDSVGVEDLNLRLSDAGIKRARLRLTTRSHPGAPEQSISQVLESGGWKWSFEPKPLVSFLAIRPGRDRTDAEGQPVEGKTERLIGLPGIAFAGWHNAESPTVSGVHLTAIGNVLEALSTDNSIAVSLGLAVSLYKDRFLFGFAWDIYDSRPKPRREGTRDYILTIQYSGLF